MAEPEAWWQRWLTPERPGLRQFALGALALLLPLPAVLLGPEHVVPAMAAGIVVGLGLGCAWSLLYLRTWAARAPAATAAILLTCFAALLHVAVVPRWDLLLRLRDAKQELARWRLAQEAGAAESAPSYQRGGGAIDRFAARIADGRALAWTPQPLQRWTPFGWVDACWLVVHPDGEVETVWSHAALAAALARAGMP